ncbi:MAG: DUF4293 domain-containing protein [Bacteroidales bacterium]
MIQRIQTLYLLAIAVLAGVMNFLTLSAFKAGEAVYELESFGLSSTGDQKEIIYSTFALFAILSVISVLSAGTIFLYKKRILQIRLCLFNMILAVGFYAAFAFYVFVIGNKFGASFSLKIPVVFPLICIILDWLAIRSIGADEALVRSYDRLR